MQNCFLGSLFKISDNYERRNHTQSIPVLWITPLWHYPLPLFLSRPSAFALFLAWRCPGWTNLHCSITSMWTKQRSQPHRQINIHVCGLPRGFALVLLSVQNLPSQRLRSVWTGLLASLSCLFTADRRGQIQLDQVSQRFFKSTPHLQYICSLTSFMLFSYTNTVICGVKSVADATHEPSSMKKVI